MAMLPLPVPQSRAPSQGPTGPRWHSGCREGSGPAGHSGPRLSESDVMVLGIGLEWSRKRGSIPTLSTPCSRCSQSRLPLPAAGLPFHWPSRPNVVLGPRGQLSKAPECDCPSRPTGQRTGQQGCRTQGQKLLSPQLS